MARDRLGFCNELRCGLRRQKHNGQSGLLAEPAGGFYSAHSTPEIQIHEHQIHVVVCGSKGYRLFAARTQRTAVPGVLEHEALRLSDQNLVFDKKNVLAPKIVHCALPGGDCTPGIRTETEQYA